MTHCNPAHGSGTRRQFIRLGSMASIALLAPGIATQSLAHTTIETLHILSSAAAGSAPDVLARLLAAQMSGGYARSVIVENRPGEAGRIAMNALKLASADGSTAWLASGSIATVSPSVYPTLGFDPSADLQPVGLIAEMPLALAVGTAVPDSVATVSDLVTWMQRNPQSANVGSPGVGSLPHLLGALLFSNAHVDWQHVAYTGGAPTVVALLGGQIAALVLPEAVLAPHRARGKLRVLATSGRARSNLMPDVPTLVEQGFRDLVVKEWFALFMLRSVPSAMVDASSQAIRGVTARPEFAAELKGIGMDAATSTPAALSARIAIEHRVWAPLILAAGIRAE